MAEKTEKATPKKMRDARKKGQVAKSQDFPSAFTFVVSIATALIMARFLYTQLAGYMVAMFRSISGTTDMEQKAGGYIWSAIEVIMNSSLPLMIIVTSVGLLVGFLVVGPMFSLQAMKLDIKRLNPITGIKNKFKLKTLFELLKSILKIAISLILIYSVMKNSLSQIIATAGIPIVNSLEVFYDFLVSVIIRVGIFFMAVAVFDLIFQKKQFAKEMKMEKFEIKQEYKDTEGNPEIKGRRREIAREVAYQEGPRAVKRARAVVTNPIHIAIALEYDPKDMPAPKIVTMGKGDMANKITEYAVIFEVPIFRNPLLAQTLWNDGNYGQFIPQDDDVYTAVAEIMKWVGALETKEKEYVEILEQS
ncbi:MAG: type III secretion system export apparatus subunit SctU [Chlamydiia bacterium]|nr:type III secretion system export apparatus subunit SctU [Chlamydiia bacterium]MCP5492901.1 type III secretion system export apparatus subunit SctU [Chlamydiales bacterium]